MSASSAWIRQTTWSAGEVDAKQFRRTNSKLYLTAAQRLQNLLIDNTGLVKKRFGFLHMADVTQYADTNSVLFPYIDKNLVPYVVQAQALQFHIFKYNISSNTLVYEATISHPYPGSQLRQIDFTVINDSLVLVHPNHAPARLYITTYGNPNTFTYEEYKISPKPAYDFGKIDYSDFDVSYTVASKVITFKFENLTSNPGFNDDWVGGQIIGGGDNPDEGLGYAIIKTVSYSAGTVTFTGDVQVPFSTTNPAPKGNKYAIRQPIFSSDLGYPSHTLFYQKRLWLANTKSLPDGIFGSKLNAFANYDVGNGQSTDAIVVTIGKDEVSPVIALNGGKQFEIYTDNAEYVVPQPEGTGLSFGTFDITQQSAYGSQNLAKPLNYQNDSYYIGKGGNTINAFRFNGIGESYASIPMNPQATHLLKNPLNRAIKRADNASEDNFIYYLNSDHTLSAFQSAVAGTLGAMSEVNFQDDVEVYDILSLNNEIFVLKGYRKTQTYVIEKMSTDRDIFQDASQTKTMPANGEISGLSMYNGYMMNVVYDGQDFGEYLVNDGSITVDNQGKTGDVNIGLLFNVNLRSMNLYLDPRMTNAKKKLKKIMVGYQDSVDFKVNGKQVPFLTYEAIQNNEGITKQTGTFIVGDTRAYQRNSTFDITQYSPFDLNIESIQYKVSGGLI